MLWTCSINGFALVVITANVFLFLAGGYGRLLASASAIIRRRIVHLLYEPKIKPTMKCNTAWLV
jgi:hypothetical protein